MRVIFTNAGRARDFIVTFRKKYFPTMTYVETEERRIDLDNMEDDDALFVANQFISMEAEGRLK